VAGAADVRAPAARNVDGYGDEQHRIATTIPDSDQHVSSLETREGLTPLSPTLHRNVTGPRELLFECLRHKVPSLQKGR
jgi:hypothetical protein